MGLKEILDALEQEAVRAIKEVEERAIAQAKRIREESVIKAEEAKRQILESEKKRIEQECKNIIFSAEAEARKMISRAREEVFELVRERIKKLVENDDSIRKKLIEVALKDAISLLDGQAEELEVSSSKKDKEYIEDFIKKLGTSAKISISNGLSSGFILKTADEKVAFALTPEIIAEKILKQYVAEISERLFES
ncbi:MAG: V-type ATP synthase subunit E [Actinobacteria bacterium]|nr:V-type ATP synthase subunit E [Actinomycetota bacterium]